MLDIAATNNIRGVYNERLSIYGFANREIHIDSMPSTESVFETM